MKHRANTKSFWDEIDYRRWEDAVSRSETEASSWSTRAFLHPLLPRLRGKSVLDLGCGPGSLTPYLASAAKSVLGMDFSAAALSVARKRCAGLENVAFVEGDILELDLGRRFDVVTGRMFLHEILHEDTPRLVTRLDSLLTQGGFIYFQENSYFNPAARFFREHLVGRFGIPKYGSDNELPFDRTRFEMYRRAFVHCERYVDGVDLFQKVNQYLVPAGRDRLAGLWAGMDRALTALQHRTGWLDNWSYTQTIYASQTVPRCEALGGMHLPQNEGR